ncbi:MAG: prepilin-type N-terminal cleavage/methylation domain-containing protein [Candidatus Dadabacteria bacterium]|nr:MAG: prepilin-type N-terminal cleavage/methylation domain-containing protein [Candidatus Dadabacteria bacterium]
MQKLPKTLHLYQTGFTMIELLVTMSIVGILSAIAFPVFAQYRNNGFDAQAKADLRHIAMAEEAYFIDNNTYKSCSGKTCENAFPSVFALSNGVLLQVTATTTGFIATASHSKGSGTSCTWDSSKEGFLGCG